MANPGTVTFLFTDLVGSTELTEKLGDEAAGELRRTHFRLLRDVAGGHQGEEVKNLGDGLMVVFTSAVEAVNCSIEMQQAVEQHNSKNATHPLQVRIGLNVGEPISDEGDYFGLPVAIAKRLCDKADGGQIVASDLVRSLVITRGGFEFDSLGSLDLKGLSDPLPSWAIGWEPVAAETLALPASLVDGDRSGFVGRSDGISQLRAVWDQTLTGRRRLALLAGEPGIGKTRLAKEFARQVHSEGGVVLYGRSDEEALVPYQPFVEALKHFVIGTSTFQLRAKVGTMGSDFALLIPDLAQRLPDVVQTSTLGSESDRFRLFEAVSAVLSEIARSQPVLLLLDDIHWADRPTLLLLKHIARSGDAAPVLILGTYRETELSRSHPLAETLADLRRDIDPTRIPLRGLAENEVAEMIGSPETAKDLAPVARAVYRETEGNPFFVAEIVRHLEETGALTRGDDGWKTNLSIEQMGIPEGIKEVIGRRLSRLSESCNKALAVASVIGRDFPLDVLEQVAELPGDSVLEALQEAVEANVVEEVGGATDVYSFSHALIRETLYGELITPRRVRLHRRIGQALETLHGDDERPPLAELGYHFLETAAVEDLDKAIDYSRRAAQQATELLAHEEAVEQLQKALQGLDAHDSGDLSLRGEVLVSLGEARRRSGEPDEARAALLEAAEIARKIESGELLARAAIACSDIWTPAIEIDTTKSALLHEALAALGDERSALRARTQARLALELHEADHDPANLDAMSLQAVEIAREAGDMATLAFCLSARNHAIWGPGGSEERLSSGTEIVELATEAGDFEVALAGHTWKQVAQLELGDSAGLQKELEAYEELADRIRQPRYLWYALTRRVMWELMHGRLEEAGKALAASLAQGQQAQEIDAPQIFAIQSLMLGREIGWHEGTVAAVQEASAANPDLTLTKVILTLVSVEVGLEDGARRGLEELAAQDFADFPKNEGWFITVTSLAAVASVLGDAKRADILYNMLLPYEQQSVLLGGAAGFFGRVSMYLGLLARTLDRLDDAVAHLEDAVRWHERMGAVPWLARARYELSRTLATRSTGDDADRAAGLRAEALQAANELGMVGFAAQIEGDAGPG